MRKFFSFVIVSVVLNLTPFASRVAFADTLEDFSDLWGATRPQLAIDSHGNAIVTWTETGVDFISSSIQAIRYDFSDGWGIPSLITSSTKGSLSPPPHIGPEQWRCNVSVATIGGKFKFVTHSSVHSGQGLGKARIDMAEKSRQQCESALQPRRPAAYRG